VLKQKRALGAATEASALDEGDLDATLYATDSDDEMASDSQEGSDSEGDSDDERLQYEAMVEEYVDAAYQGYLERKDARAAQKVEQRKRKRLAEDEGTGVCPVLIY
jgi:AdoMet-dependent rRNA methyltransferase SPB1